MKHLFTTIILALATFVGVAQTQRPTISAELDRDSVAIGDRVTLSVTVDKDIMQVVAFPEVDTEKAQGIIEVVESAPVDTVKVDGRRIRLTKRYTLTSFDAGNYHVSGYPVLYVDKNIIDTLYSPDTLLLRVTTFDIDTATMTIHDIRPVKHVPVKFGEWAGWATLGLLALAMLVALVWVIVRLAQKKPVFGKEKPAEPPHEKAIRELNELVHQKLWQNGRHKQYYTRLTDILREYLDGRYGVGAMEMTTDEILTAIRPLELEPKQVAMIDDLLHTADFVKFAKHAPDAEQNETLYTGVYYFVENTKQVDLDGPNNEYKEAMKV